MSGSLRPHKLQHAKPPCPSPTLRVHPKSCPLSQWCHPAISSSLVPFYSCPQSLPASESFPVSQLCMRLTAEYWSFSFSISLSKEQPGLISFRMDWLDLLAVQVTTILFEMVLHEHLYCYEIKIRVQLRFNTSVLWIYGMFNSTDVQNTEGKKVRFFSSANPSVIKALPVLPIWTTPNSFRAHFQH